MLNPSNADIFMHLLSPWVLYTSLNYTCSIYKQVLEMATNPHYLYRMTIINAISLLAPVMGAEITCAKLLPIVVNAAKDRYTSLFLFWLRKYFQT